MELAKSMMIILLTGILTDNFVLSKFMGICPFLGVSKKLDSSVGMGMAVTFVMICATLCTFPVYTFLLDPMGLSYLRTIAFILIIALFVQLVEIIMKKKMPALYKSLGVFLPLITTNCAVLGAALLNIEKGYNFIQSLVFGFSAAIGFTLAIVIFAGVRERMKYANPPKAFSGFPILLLAAALIAMAFSGFSGISFS